MGNQETRRFSQSEFKVFACRRRWWLSEYRRLAPIGNDPTGPLRSGSRVHIGLEAFYTPGADPFAELANAQAADWSAYVSNCAELGESPDASVAEAFNRDCQLERIMLEGYGEWIAESGEDAGLQVIALEEIVSVPGSSFAPELVAEYGDFDVVGKLDARFRREMDGARKFMDHKPQPLSSHVLTPEGWVKMGDISVGDTVMTANGSTAAVLNVFDRGVDDVYEVTLNDGTSVRGTRDHPWWSKMTVKGRYGIVETDKLKSKVSRIDHFKPTSYTEDFELRIDPYTLGAWIANGHRDGRGMCDGDERTMLLTGFPVSVRTRYENSAPLYTASADASFRRDLDSYGLRGLYSSDRFIPSEYLYKASYGQRMQLLHGLMDGDGSLTTTFSSIYSTASLQLANDVMELVRSLGAWAKIQMPKRKNRVGSVANGYDTENYNYIVSVRSEFNPFHAIDHKERWQEHKDAVRGSKGTSSTDKIVKSVSYVGREHVRCIEIDSEQHLYVTDGYAVSHNTAASLTMALPTLQMNTQMKHYRWLESKTTPEGEQADGALYNVLKKVKRTKAAKPPFFARYEINHNQDELDNYEKHMKRMIRQILALEVELAGTPLEEQAHVAYPSPDESCSWKCQFFQLCGAFDDGSRAEDMIRDQFVTRDPLARYAEGDKPATT